MSLHMSGNLSVAGVRRLLPVFRLTNRKTLFLMALPCLAFMIVFLYSPILGWIIAFFDYKPGIPLSITKFAGLKYFKLAVAEPELLQVLRNTLILSFLGLAMSPLSPAFAILLSEMRSKVFKKLVQTVTTLPNFISWILVYSIFFTFFSSDGFVNTLLQGAGLIGEPLNVLANNGIVWFFQTGVSLWKGLGFGAIIYLAAINGISPELYDAAAVDGAGRLRKILHVIVPGLLPTYVTMFLLGIGNILSSGFEQYYVFYNPLVHQNIQVLDLYLYRIGITLNDFPLSTALGISKTLVSVILLFTANRLSKKLMGQAII